MPVRKASVLRRADCWLYCHYFELRSIVAKRVGRLFEQIIAYTQFKSTTICLLRTFRLTAAFTHVKSRVGRYFLLGQVIGDFLKLNSLFFLLFKFRWVMQNVQATWTEHHSTNTRTKYWEVSSISFALSYNQNQPWLSTLMNQWELKTNDKSAGKRVWASPVTTDTDHSHDVWINIELCWYIASKTLSCPHVCVFLVLIVEYTTTLNSCSPLSYLQLFLSFNLDGFSYKQYVFFYWSSLMFDPQLVEGKIPSPSKRPLLN